MSQGWLPESRVAERVGDDCKCQGLMPKSDMATRVKYMAAQVRDVYQSQGCLPDSGMAARVKDG